MKKATPEEAAMDPSVLIDEKIATLGDWRGKTLGKLRTLIRTWSRNGSGVCRCGRTRASSAPARPTRTR
jgi:hypothetical protein